MTSQPYTPQFESPTEPSADSSGAPDTISEFDPDIVVLDDDDVEDVTGVTAPQGSHVLTEPGLDEPAGNEPVLSEQWHDIQAMFVDDPQGSVDRAAAAADDAVGALVASLRQRLPAGLAGDPGDTEQLRSTLRSYRDFCQRVADLEEELLQAARWLAEPAPPRRTGQVRRERAWPSSARPGSAGLLAGKATCRGRQPVPQWWGTTVARRQPRAGQTPIRTPLTRAS